ncbi:hypothetical protein PQX77_002379 [Marasmius sp. AFHP31]|nr:hypothetical protein PQX77_002379 [Marasmius sp. AFHP31]
MAKMLYGHKPLDRARFDKPLVPALNAKKKQAVAASVETNAMQIQAEFGKGMEQLKDLKKVLDRIKIAGCVDCWVLGNAHSDSNDHATNAYFESHLTQIRNIELPYNPHWPYCFVCWAPLREPLQHPPPAPNKSIDREKCPFRLPCSITGEHEPVLPWLIAFIFGLDQKQSDGKTIREGIVQALNASWKTIRDLHKWLKMPQDDLADVPNPIRFVVTYYNLYHKLSDV